MACRWVFPLFIRGYKRDLGMEDLYRCPAEDEAGKLVLKLDAYVEICVQLCMF